MITRKEPERGTETVPQESARALAMDGRGPVGRVGPTALIGSLSRVVLFLVSLTLFLVAIELIRHGATGAAGLISRYLDINRAHNALGFGWSASYLVMSGSPEPATLLGVIERSEDRAQVDQALQKGKEWLAGAPAPRTKVREGQAGEQILEEAASGEYDLLVVGIRGRQGITRFLLGSTAERIARQAAEPVLLVQGERDSVERILVCTAGGKPGLAAVKLAGHVARLAEAEVTVLHVMSQLPASPILPHVGALQVMPQTPAPQDLPDAQVKDLRASAEQLMRGDTREGAHLREALAILVDLGVTAEARVRHGLIIDEILAEIREGDHGLVVVGSRSAGGWMRFLLNDVGQQIIDCTNRPVLVARS